MRNTYLEPAWWLHHPRRRCGKQCVIVCREIHNRALCFTERGSTWPLRHIQPEETVRRDSVLRHTQHHLSGSLLHVVLNLLISQRGSHLCPSLSLSLSFIHISVICFCRCVMTWWRGSRISVSACRRFVAALHRGHVTAPSLPPTPDNVHRRVYPSTGATRPSAVSVETRG